MHPIVNVLCGSQLYLVQKRLVMSKSTRLSLGHTYHRLKFSQSISCHKVKKKILNKSVFELRIIEFHRQQPTVSCLFSAFAVCSVGAPCVFLKQLIYLSDQIIALNKTTQAYMQLKRPIFFFFYFKYQFNYVCINKNLIISIIIFFLV